MHTSRAAKFGVLIGFLRWHLNSGKELHKDVQKRFVALQRDGLGKPSYGAVAKRFLKRPGQGRPKKLSPHVQGHTWVASETRCMSTTSIIAEVGLQTMYLPLYQTGLHGPHPRREPPLKLLLNKTHKQFVEKK